MHPYELSDVRIVFWDAIDIPPQVTVKFLSCFVWTTVGRGAWQSTVKQGPALSVGDTSYLVRQNSSHLIDHPS